ncbi:MULTISPECIES: YdcF family protein [unclassified Nocardioides]|uniref:YdcF family protein n=1 Tax=unclassified Nocardioides TaxID=2615069 RepID=UPI0030150739
MTGQEQADLDRVGRYLARRDPGADTEPADVLVLCGSAVLASVEVAADLWRRGVVPTIVITGGVGHSTSYLRAAVAHTVDDVPTAGRSEAAVLGDLLARAGVPSDAVRLEEEATNCGENARFTLDLLGPGPGTLLVLQDPTMQRRTHASFEHLGARVRSWAPLVPIAAARAGVWSEERFRSLVLGEVRRLRDDEHGYGPRGAGFIGHVDVPGDVLAAADRLAAAHPGSVRAAVTDSGQP